MPRYLGDRKKIKPILSHPADKTEVSRVARSVLLFICKLYDLTCLSILFVEIIETQTYIMQDLLDEINGQIEKWRNHASERKLFLPCKGR